MNCPACKTTLAATDLPAAPAQSLSARACETCGGRWIEGDIYLLWVQRQGTHQPEKQPAESDADAPPPAAQKRANLCPKCGRILVRARVGHGLAFQVERCGGCGGFWLDAGEWDALLARNLHDDLHLIFSDAWQAEVLRQDRQSQYARRMAARLGDADWREVRRVKAWLDGHPRRAELYAFLVEGPEA